jgi:hypothetical protein
LNQGTRWVRFGKKNRGRKSRETITFREPQFCFKLCCQDCVRPKILQDSRVKITISIDSCESCYEISVCETCYKRVSLQNLSVRLARSESRYEISVCETRETLASLLILTRESRENLWSKKRVSLFARISKSNSRVNSSCTSRVVFLVTLRRLFFEALRYDKF